MMMLMTILIIVLDQVSKYIIMQDEALHLVPIIPGFFQILYAKNTGMAWSMLSGQSPLLALVSAVVILGMVWYIQAKKPKKWTRLALYMMMGGAIGNLIDRLWLGYVRDFLDFYIFGYDFPVFNIADAALCIGVAILFIASFIEEDTHGTKTTNI